jgi:hypothetical protein
LLPHHGHSVEFSPYTGDTVAVTGSQNYGIAGPGVLVVFSKLGPNTAFAEVRRYGWSDAVFDVTWSEEDHRILVCGTGDGKILLFNQQNTEGPVGVIDGHTAEVSSMSASWTYSTPSLHPAGAQSTSWTYSTPSLHPAGAQSTSWTYSTPSLHPAGAQSTSWTYSTPSLHPAGVAAAYHD